MNLLADKGLKICIIGGGSSYTPEFVEGLLKKANEIPVRELWLVDIEEGKEKLEIIASLTKRMIRRQKLSIKVFSTLDRKQALKDADFVTTQIRVGLLKARIHDERIPLKYGMIGQETTGAGGLFKALRTIPVLIDIANEMAKLCPNAWLLNFTNPAGMVTEAILKYSGHQKVIGLCNVPIHMKMSIADLLQIRPQEVTITFGGLNHLSYGLDVVVQGDSKLSEVIDLLSKPKHQGTMKNIIPLPWDETYLKALHLVPSPYHRYYYKAKEILANQLKDYEKGTTRAETVERLEQKLFELYKDPNLSEKPPQLKKRGGAYYSDAACMLISSLYNDTRDIQTLNVRNQGAISQLAEDAVVEVNCVVTSQGPIPLSIGELPSSISGLIQQMNAFEEIAIKAAVTGSYEKTLLALCMNPLVTSDIFAKKILDEMMQVHRKYLPQFS